MGATSSSDGGTSQVPTTTLIAGIEDVSTIESVAITDGSDVGGPSTTSPSPSSAVTSAASSDLTDSTYDALSLPPLTPTEPEPASSSSVGQVSSTGGMQSSTGTGLLFLLAATSSTFEGDVEVLQIKIIHI